VVNDLHERDMTKDHMLREFFLGFVKIHVLHHAGEQPVYGLALIAELRRHGYELSPGTLYPVLHQLEQAGYLRRLNRIVSGKVRKYYVLTRRGGQALNDARAKIGELMGEVLETNVVRGEVKARKSPARERRRVEAERAHTGWRTGSPPRPRPSRARRHPEEAAKRHE
jgi:PadR family transcriptional regulator PadR